MNAFIRVAIGEFDWSSVVWHVGQTISASRSAWRGGPAHADGRADERQNREQPPSRAGSLRCAESGLDALGVGRLVALGVDASLDPLTDELPERSTKNVSGNPVTPHLPSVEPEPS